MPVQGMSQFGEDPERTTRIACGERVLGDIYMGLYNQNSPEWMDIRKDTTLISWHSWEQFYNQVFSGSFPYEINKSKYSE